MRSISRIAAAALSLASLPLTAHAGAPTEVEVVRNGDDGVTVTLAASVAQAFGRSDAFVLSGGGRANALVVVVQSPTAAARAGIHYKLAFPIRFTSVQGQTLGFSEVTCQENTLDKCADQVVTAAGPAAAKLGRH
ncbi:hypothetical protein [Nitrospirillum iridis]|uniref:Uncharacterized protein n=1 Tax=Nitrospirillum iridis TaxID=765888 RepID=A0A7X0EC26_9PROT|nr:hypothetical protein [Nitrospirillum iridis]MBB6251188.1 hypothetical protein [Nitrospirillum iridis]